MQDGRARPHRPGHPDRGALTRSSHGHTLRVESATAQALADGYIAYSTTGDRSVLQACNRVAWSQVHIFRLDEGMVVEHWAVRDDDAMLDAVKA
jgi:hypothetical protein